MLLLIAFLDGGYDNNMNRGLFIFLGENVGVKCTIHLSGVLKLDQVLSNMSKYFIRNTG